LPYYFQQNQAVKKKEQLNKGKWLSWYCQAFWAFYPKSRKAVYQIRANDNWCPERV